MDPVLIANGLNISFEIVTLALVAMGLAVTLGLLGVLNLAHGEFVMIGAFCAFFVQEQGLSYLWAFPLVVIVCIVIGWPVERTIIRALYSRPFDTILATWGLSLLLREIVEFFFGPGFNSVDQPVSGTVNIFGADYPLYQLLVMLIAVVLIGALVAWYIKSSTGRRIQALVDNPDLAKSVGIPTLALARNTFIFGLCLAGIAGVLLAPIVAVYPGMGIDHVLKSFFVLVVGGLGNVVGLVVGSGVIGGAESVVAAILDRTAGYTFVLIVALLFLWKKPGGLVSR